MSLKIRLSLFLNETGTPQTFVARTIGIHKDTLNKWLKGHRPLPHVWINKIDEYLIQRGY